MISGGFLKKGESDEQKIVEGRQKYDAALAEKILSAEVRPELIVLAGWMHVFSTAFLDPIKKAGINIINLHPSVFQIYYLRTCLDANSAFSVRFLESLTELVPLSEPTMNSRPDD